MEAFLYQIGIISIYMRLDGQSVKEIYNTLGIKSESQIYIWYYWYRGNQPFRCNQGIGRQYSFGHGPEHLSKEENLTNSNQY